jgi:methyl-accepting chemotaxis protein
MQPHDLQVWSDRITTTLLGAPLWELLDWWRGNPTFSGMTILWLLLIGVIFIFAYRRLIRRLVRVCRSLDTARTALRSRLAEVGTGASPHELLQNAIAKVDARDAKLPERRRPRVAEQLRVFHREWRNNAVTLTGAERRSTVLPADYLSFAQILPAGSNWNVSRMMPGVFTTLGIFGTFVGLALGVTLLSFRFSAAGEDVGLMRQGVIGLMQGMGTAFWTSIVGIVCALAWMVRDRQLSRRADLGIQGLCSDLSELFPALDDQAVARLLIELSAEQKDTTKSLAMDIATQLGDRIQQDLIPVLQEFNKSVSDRQLEGVERLVDKFGEMMGERMQQQFDNLATTIEQLCQWQREARDNLDAMLTKLQEVAAKQNEMLLKTMEAAAAFDRALPSLMELHERLAAALQAFQLFAEELGQLHQNVRETSSELQRSVEQTTDSLRQTVASSQQAATATARAMQSAVTESTQALSRTTGEVLQAMQDAVAEANEALVTQVTAMRQDLERTATQIGELVQQQARLVPEVLSRIESLVNATAQQAETLDAQLRTSMEKFREDCAKGLELTFSDFDKHLSLLTKALSGTIQETEEAVRQILGKIQQVGSMTDSLREAVQGLNGSAAQFTRAIERMAENGRITATEGHASTASGGHSDVTR